MMTLADIESWVRGGESETQEFKRTTGERREAARTICAVLSTSAEGMALREVCRALGDAIPERQVRVELAALRVLGLASSSGHGAGARWRLE